MEFVYLGIGLIVGAAIMFFFGKSKRAAIEALLNAEKNDRAEDEKRLEERITETKTECQQRIAEAKAEAADMLAKQKAEAADMLAKQKAESADMLAKQKAEAADMLAKQKAESADMLAKQKAEAKEMTEVVKTEADDRRMKEIADLKQSYEQQMKLFKEEMKTATDALLKERSSALQSANTEQMETLFKPLKDNIERMEKSIVDNREAQARNTQSIEKTMEQMMLRTADLGQQADRLSNALQRKNKTAGNWGELILTELLESQGLQQGIHFDAQQSMKDELGHSLLNEDNGSRMIPDVVLHLADNRDVIIDSKMSLTAFADYQNAETEEEKKDAAQRHLDSVRAHIKELTAKSYSDYVKKPRVSSDFVIMFVPIEGALQLALSEAPELWREAFEKKVFLVGGQTLIAALRIIDLTWVNVQQERNTQKIMDEARKLVDRVGQFYTQFEEVGKKLNAAQEAYKNVTDKVKDGRQSILGAGRNLEELGVRGKKALPQIE